MALTSNFLKKQVDLPIWENLRFAPSASVAASCTSCADNGQFHPVHGRYIYYLIATAMWRYDTWTDTYLQLSSPPIAPATWTTMKFAGSSGVDGNILGATSNTVTIPAYSNKVLKTYDIQIINGTGMGQRKIITDVSAPITYDAGVATAVANALGGISITDSTKAWTVNQWAGYQLRITFGSGVSQVKRILYNTATVLTMADSTMTSITNFSNPMIFSPAISSTGPVQSMYAIEASVVTVDSPWLTPLDLTSVYRVDTGMLYLYSSAAATPFYTVQQYDVISDTWYIRTANTLNITAVGTDATVEKTTENASMWQRGFATSGTSQSLVDTRENWIPNQWSGYNVRIFTGTGEGVYRPIVSNTVNTLTWASASVTPDSSSGYIINGFDGGLNVTGSSLGLDDYSKNWTPNRWSNYAVKIHAGTGKGQLIPIASNTTSSLRLITSWSIQPDATSTYSIQADIDKNYLMMGANAAVLIHNIDDDLGTFGRKQDSGVARIASVQFGRNKAVAIASATHASAVATITTAIPHGLKIGMSASVRGFTDSNYNTSSAVITVPSTTTFTYNMAGTPAADTIVSALTTQILVDSTKSWTPNQWSGSVVYMNSTAVTAASGLATGQALAVLSNTATTLTFVVAATAPLNGVSRYIITPHTAIGAIDSGIAMGAGQSGTALQDTSKVGAFVGSVPLGSNILTISAVTPPGLLLPGHAVTGTSIPAGTVIINQLTGTTGGIGTYTMSANATALISSAAITSGWVVNIHAGKKVKILNTTAAAQEVTCTANTNNTLTFGAITLPVTGQTTYAILQQPVRGTGINLNWAFGTTDQSIRGKYMIVARGGAVQGFDRWDMTTDTFDLMPITPQLETLTAGSMYAYDGTDRIYFTKEVSLRMYYLDISANVVHGAGMVPYLPGLPIIGNRMEIFQTDDGLKYLWLNRQSNQDCFRQLLFW